MANTKISELPYASVIDDDALVVLVQDHSNKVVTVDELSQKINEKQNHAIDHLWHELRRATGMESIRALSNTAANHEYRIDGIEKLNGKQDAQLTTLTNALRDVSTRQAYHHNDIKLLQNGVSENRKGLAHANTRIDKLTTECNTYFSEITELSNDLKALTTKHDEDVSYIKQYIGDAQNAAYSYASYWTDIAVANSYAYTAYQVDNNWAYTYSSYAYLATYVHYNCNEYWGGVKEIADIYGEFEPNFVGYTYAATPDTPSTTNKCKEGCTC